MILALLFLLGGLVFLYFGAEGLVRGAVQLGRLMGVSPIVIGLTVVSVGTSAPELVVCIVAALRGSPDLVVGNILGSNMANIGLILGLAALIRPMQIHSQVVRREIPWMVGVTLLTFLLFWNLDLGRFEGAIMATTLGVYLLFLFLAARREGEAVLGEAAELLKEQTTPLREGGVAVLARPALLILAGGVGLVVGGQGIVTGATEIAQAFGISDMVIGLSILAVGTSLPELATTLLAAVRREADLAVGNIVGSNIFNLTFVLGSTALVHPIQLSPRTLTVEYPLTLGITLLLVPLMLVSRNLTRGPALVLLLGYAGAWVYILQAG
jgi:cation:H+ antiporter